MISIPALLIVVAAVLQCGCIFTVVGFSQTYTSYHSHKILWCTSNTKLCMSDQPTDEEGADLAAQFFKAVSDRDISIEGDEIDFSDADESEMMKDDGTVAYEGDNSNEDLDDNDDAILREYDVTSDESASFTNEQMYGEVKDRMFESAGAFVELSKGADESGASEEDGFKGVYQPPSTEPDSGLTAGEVVEVVLKALRNNDNPRTNYGIEVLFGYSSAESQIMDLVNTEGLTPDQYRKYLISSDDNMALFDHTGVVIDKADYSPDRLKTYFTARLTGVGEDFSVNFILSTNGTNDEDSWLIDSLLIRPSKYRKRRRR